MQSEFKEDDQIGGYRIIRPLGKGGMGCVYEVEHEKLDVEPQNAVDAKKATTTQFILGTRAYMVPEVKIGCAATAASDAYSLGLVFFRLLAGVWYTGKPKQAEILANFECDWRTALPWLLNPKVTLRPSRLADVVELLGGGLKRDWRNDRSGMRQTHSFWRGFADLKRRTNADGDDSQARMKTLTGARDNEVACPFCRRMMGLPAGTQDASGAPLGKRRF